jgi:hypothetical protein
LKMFRQREMQVPRTIISSRHFLTVFAGLDNWARTTVSRELFPRMC